ncbi:BlaI/MecI/CopY family transcriptional regulator [Pseudoalteromonas denitrificans]|jgi:predicted transcriptional regulator|uniref:Predicted transcriptional regulator n=1 Tax=Pseudoalteromonas denitrificans DSM 6059 TaxID=1123010 RepID=A0A1I1RFR7_9GAMM|nr:BlaI/MecI/CopY family transcriptional regulator [Pseudoalteromonas denitrificans]SFD33161.1 Predicted transcriptional regulator [Pseudoalteromonas denitrificans DSM 6059]
MTKKTVPTKAELNILNILWKVQPSTVRQVHEVLSLTQSTGYTTTLKTMQVMHEKGLVQRDESSRAHLYKAKESSGKTQNSLIKDILSKAFGGSKYDLVVSALGEKASSDEINEIRELLNTLEEQNKK